MIDLNKLAAQSLVYVDTGLADGRELIFSKEKFAELIVRECVRIGQETSKEIFKMSKKEGDIFEYESHGAEQVVDNIKEHFGVEE